MLQIRPNRRGLRRFILLVILAIFFVLVFILLTNSWYIFRDLIYLGRPLFDNPQKFRIVPHYHDSSFTTNNTANYEELCSIHGWARRQVSTDDHSPKVIDAIIFSVELDLLELRLKELWPVVDYFIVLEADRTFSGQSKRLILKENIDRFIWAKDKLIHYQFDRLKELKPGENPFQNEGEMRAHMTTLIWKHARNGDLIIMADVDEIPRRSTIALLKHCTGYPSPIHLQLKTYFYSFEFFFSYDDSWRAKVEIYQSSSFGYNHNKHSDYLLADSGWHCTFCFRYIRDFRFKMTSYSHNDRLMNRMNLLEADEIQQRICTGRDVFDMYPEVYSYRELIQKIGRIPSTSSLIDLPVGLIKGGNRFRYLLKGNCIREDYQGKYKPRKQLQQK